MPSKNIPVNGWPQIKELDIAAPVLAELDKIEAWQKSVKQETKTGAEVTYTNALALPAVSVSAEIEASQDLHGYDHPWVGGTGKNKLPMTVSRIKAANTDGTWNGNVYTLNNVTFELLTDSASNITGIKVNGTNSSGADIVFNVSGQFTFTSNVNYIISGITTGASNTYDIYGVYKISGSTAYTSVTTGDINIVANANDICYGEFIRLRNGQSISNITFYPMFRLSTETDATFAPYSNICPISGHTSVTITDYDSESNTATVTIQLGQTVYGGTLNVTTGELTIDRQYQSVTLDSIYVRSGNANCDYAIFVIDNAWGDFAAIDNSFISDMMRWISSDENFDNISESGVALVYSTGTKQLAVSVPKGYTIEQASALFTGAHVCLSLATPQTIQLTPTQLTMLKGYNRLSADTGNIEVTAYTGNKWN